MKVQFATYDLITEDNNIYSSAKIPDEYHQTWHYVYFSYSHSSKSAVGGIRYGDANWEVETFNNINHNDRADIKELKFYLGSSDSSKFQSINGYFYNAALYTNKGSLKTASETVVYSLGLTQSA